MRDCLVVLNGLRNSAQKGTLSSNCHPAELTIIATQNERVEHANTNITETPKLVSGAEGKSVREER